jgi:hypothetical protein
MMSTAIAISVGGELTKVNSAVSDRVGDEGMTFAQTFGERAGLSTDGQVKSTAGDTMKALRERKDELPLKNSEELAAAAGGAGSKTIASKGGHESDDAGMASKNSLATKNPVASPVTTVSGLSKNIAEPVPVQSGRLPNTVLKSVKAAIPQSKPMVADSKTAAADSKPAEKELPTGKEKGVGEGSATVPKGLTAGQSKDVELTPHVGAAGSDSLPVIKKADEEPSVRQGKLPEDNQDVASAKKIEKANGAGGSKTVGHIANPKTVEAQSTGGDDTPGGAAPVQTLPPGGAQGIDIGKTVVSGSGEVVSTSGSAAAGPSMAPDNSRPAGIAAAGKSEAEGAEDTLNPSTTQTDPTRSRGGSVDSDAVSAPAGKDSNGRMGAVVAATAVHADAASSPAASGAVPGMTFGHALADVAGVKAQVAGEAVAHATSLHAGSAEQEGAGTVDTGGMHRMLGATPTSLEVGLANGTQGWLKIRAEMTGGGQVNASLSSATPAGQEMLHRELPALTAYLHQERVAVNTVVVHAATAAGAAFQPSGGTEADQRGQMQQQDPKRGGEEERQGVEGIASDRVEDAMSSGGLNGLSENELLSPGMFAGGGGYLNVRA